MLNSPDVIGSSERLTCSEDKERHGHRRADGSQRRTQLRYQASRQAASVCEHHDAARPRSCLRDRMAKLDGWNYCELTEPFSNRCGSLVRMLFVVG